MLQNLIIFRLLRVAYALNREFLKLLLVLPSIAQLVERRTVVQSDAVILRSLVRFRLEGRAAVLDSHC